MSLDRWTTPSISQALVHVPFPHILFLRCRPEAAAEARLFVCEYLAVNAPDASEDHLDQVVLVASELVTNAVCHGGVPGDLLRLTIDADDCRTRIEVHDSVRRHPCMRTAAYDDVSGRGLTLVDALCLGGWGARDTTTGKAVWAELHAS
ncbi:ATP-binding protein [Streptomyces sp. JW3]|uniref:ATP-binding protein n=1 Tax=Streptomyces sp. JW3 TaxID=3456955 RepID=UPI003FA48FE5